VASLLRLGVVDRAYAGEPPVVVQPPRPRPPAAPTPTSPTPDGQPDAPLRQLPAEPCPALAERDWQSSPDCAPPGEDAGAGTKLAVADGASAESPSEAGAGGGAEADEFSDWPCVLLPRPGCGTQAHIELGMGWGESHSYVGIQWSYRGFAEAGVLVGLGRDWQLGPVLEAAFDLGRVNSGWGFVPKIKSRYWMGGWYVALDGALGWSLERFSFDHGTESGTRMGAQAELAITAFGLIGPYASLSTLGDPDGIGGTETRWIVGFRGGLLTWAGVVSGFGEGLSGGW
jgi:hypothetical protein